MDELLKMLFGVREAQVAPVMAFPLQNQGVTVSPIDTSPEPYYDERLNIGSAQVQQQPGFMDRLRSMGGEIVNPLSGLENKFNAAITPQIPMYMQGLLGAEAEAKLPEQARRAGLLNAAAALLQAGGPNPQRISLGQAVGAGLQGYQQGSQGAFDQVLKGLAMRAQLAGESPKLTGDLGNAAQLLYKTSDPSKLPAGATENIMALAKSLKAPLVQNIMGGAEKARAKVIGEETGKQQIEQFNLAQSAASNISKVDQTLDILESSDPTTGLGAETINNVNRLKAFFGSESAKRKVSDTEYLDALLGSDVFPQIGALGIGARGLDTPAEREFLRKVMTGTIDMNKDTLIRLTKMRRNIQERAIKKFNKEVEAGDWDQYFEASGRPKRLFEIPKRTQQSGGPPAGISQQEWNFMTPEEKALFK